MAFFDNLGPTVLSLLSQKQAIPTNVGGDSTAYTPSPQFAENSPVIFSNKSQFVNALHNPYQLQALMRGNSLSSSSNFDPYNPLALMGRQNSVFPELQQSSNYGMARSPFASSSGGGFFNSPFFLDYLMSNPNFSQYF